MSTSTLNSQVPVHRHNPRSNMPSARVPPQQPQYQQPQRYNNHSVDTNSSSAMNYTQDSPSTPPRTPRRMANGGQTQSRNATVESAAESGAESQPESRSNRRKPQKAAFTPAAQRFERGTPPVRMHSDGPSKPAPTGIAAYAGPTFHASPAPSALPIPSFYSKSVPDSPSLIAAKAGKGQESSSSNSSSTDSPPSVTSELTRQPTPLEMLMSASRRETERARSAQSDSGPFRPPSNPPANGVVTPLQGRPPFRSTGSASSMFAMEMEGNQGQPYGPAFSTPYSERMNAARSTPQLVASPNASSVGLQKPADTSSEALKALLFNSRGTPSSQPQPTQGPFANVASPAAASPVPYQNGYQNGYQNSPRTSSPASNYHNSPQQQQRFPYRGPSNGYQNSPRTSGLRQEFTSFRSPNQGQPPSHGQFPSPQFPPPQVSLNYKENSASGPNGALASMNRNSAPRAVSQPANVTKPANPKLDLEDKLRNLLHIGSPNPVVPSGAIFNGVSGP